MTNLQFSPPPGGISRRRGGTQQFSILHPRRAFCIGLAALLAASATADAARTVTVSCRFDAPQLASGAYVRVSIPGCTPLQRRGLPQMPFRTVQLVLPPRYRITHLSVRADAPLVMLDGTWKIDYGRTPIPTRLRTDPPPAADLPDAAVYHSMNRYPAERVELASIQTMAGYRIAVLRVYPLQYEPAAGRLEFAPALTVIAAVVPDTSAAPVPSSTRRAIAPSVANPAVLGEYTLRKAGSGTADYLLVTSSNLVAAFQPLLDFHSSNGLSVRTETMETITNTWSGRDDAEKLRNYIRFAYTNWAIQYVLLGGDITVVPYRGVYATCSGYTRTSMASDLYFACLDGSWNSDNDSLWGEPNDGEGGGDVDLLAEVFVGRAPVETPTETSRFVDKTISFSTSAWNRLTACFAGQYLGFAYGVHAQGGTVLDRELCAFTNSHRTVNRLDDRPSNTYTWLAPEAIAALNLAPPLVAHFGHAEYPFDEVMWIESSHLDALSNTCPFILYSTACNVGEFNNPLAPDSIGEQFILHSRYGACAGIMNTDLGWYDYSNAWFYSGEFQHHFFDGLLVSNRTAIGAAHQIANHDMVGTVETNGANMVYRWCYFGINLLGDPALRVESPVVPFVDITNGPMQAAITDPFSVAGTNNAAVCGNLWVVNTTNAQSASFPAALSWTSTSISIALGPNSITVFGTNFIGEVASDSIEVIGMPEPAAAAALFVMCCSLFLRARNVR